MIALLLALLLSQETLDSRVDALVARMKVSLDAVEPGWKIEAAGARGLQLVDGKLWFLRGDGRAVALDPATGEAKWTSAQPLHWTRFAVAAERIVGAKDGTVQALDLKSGKITEAGPIGESPIWTDGNAFMFIDGSSRMRLVGKKKWEFALTAFGPHGMAGGRAVIYNGDDLIAAYNPDDGKQAWVSRTDQGLNFMGRYDDFLVVRTRRYRMRAYDAGTGKSAWIEDIEGDDERDATIVRAGDRLYLFGAQKIRAREIKTGKLAWSGAPEWYVKSHAIPVIFDSYFAWIAGTQIVVANNDLLGAVRVREECATRPTGLVTDGQRLFYIADGHVIRGEFVNGRKEAK